MSDDPDRHLLRAGGVHIVPALQAVRADRGRTLRRRAGLGGGMAGRDVVLAEGRAISQGREEDPSGGVAPESRLRVLDASSAAERAAWLALWSGWPAREVMAHPEYAQLFAGPGDRAIAVAWEGGGATVLFPLVLRPLAAQPWAATHGERWDATTPYGYGGPFTWGDAPPDAGAFWRAYEAWCQRTGVVCTFARLSLFADEVVPVRGRVDERGPNVVVSVAAGIEAAWRGYDREVRRRLRVARREGVTVEIDRTGARLGEFDEVYAHTMARRGADGWYRFPRAFFERLVERLPGQFAFVHACAGGRVVSSELALVSARRVYAFLGGTRAEHFRLYPNETVRHATAEWASTEGKAEYVLGGGKAPDDGILRHKRLLAPSGDVPFRTASLVHDAVAYHALTHRRDAAEAAAGRTWAPRPGFFPAYRG